MTSILEDPFGYGRIVKKNGRQRIVEQKDASEEEKKIKKSTPESMSLITKSFSKPSSHHHQ
jgi:bifunctional UDP-N-acetylglucosamine pyrophosphorylase/glucosamine-1-phosphate N-acetyltransferase